MRQHLAPVVTSPNLLLEQRCKQLAGVKKDGIPALRAAAIEIGQIDGLEDQDCVRALKWACQRNRVYSNQTSDLIESTILAGLSEGRGAAVKLPESEGIPTSKPEAKLVRLADRRTLNWREMRGKDPAPSLHNAQVGFAAMTDIAIRHDKFHGRFFIEATDGTEHDVNPLIGEINDSSLLLLRNRFSQMYGFDPTEGHTFAAVMTLAHQNEFNPVLDLIDTAQGMWDGTERLDRMAADYLSAEDTELNSLVIRKHMIAAVRRVRQPGCKYDQMPVLEGLEGWNKSSAVRIIAGAENFSDEPILASRGKEAMEQLRGIWMHECAELTGIKKADVEFVKAFLSRQQDRHRPAYGRVVVNQPRQSVEWGTTNDSEYLTSQTGNRRFAPIKLTGPIDLDKLARDRLQLIGEAAHYEAEGESLFIPESMWGAARIEQDKRRQKHPWEDVLAQIPASLICRTPDKELIHTADLMNTVLGISPKDQSPMVGKAVRQAMEQNGWTYDQVKINGKNRNGYWRYLETKQ